MFTSKRITTMGGDKFRDEHSLAFDGSNDYIDTGNTFQSMLRGGFSISAWVKMDDGVPSGLKTICGSRNSSDEDWWYFGIASSEGNEGKMIIYHKTNNDPDIGYSDAAVFPNGATGWGHLVISATINTATDGYKMFFNGKLVGVDPSNGISTSNWEAFTTSDNVYLGGYNDDSSVSNLWDGKISEIAFYSKALNSSEVATIYNGREPYNHKEGIATGNLEAWYRMGDGLENHSGTTIYDMSVNSNNGTMTNMAADDFTGDAP